LGTGFSSGVLTGCFGSSFFTTGVSTFSTGFSTGFSASFATGASDADDHHLPKNPIRFFNTLLIHVGVSDVVSGVSLYVSKSNHFFLLKILVPW